MRRKIVNSDPTTLTDATLGDVVRQFDLHSQGRLSDSTQRWLSRLKFGFATVFVVLWLVNYFPLFYQSAHDIITCRLSCNTTPASQYYPTLYAETAISFGAVLLFLFLGVRARRTRAPVSVLVGDRGFGFEYQSGKAVRFLWGDHGLIVTIWRGRSNGPLGVRSVVQALLPNPWGLPRRTQAISISDDAYSALLSAGQLAGCSVETSPPGDARLDGWFGNVTLRSPRE